ncbi:MAG TPA: Do family serine endopeptidase [Devosiaceae bacterium]
MRSRIFSRSRKMIVASTLAIALALGGGATAFMLTSESANAQITVPSVAPSAGFADLVAAVKPAVVSITVDGQEKVQNSSQYYFNFPDLPPDNPLRRFFDQFGPDMGQGPGNGPNGQPPVRKFVAAGSGFIISGDGYVVTNNHVVENAQKVTVVYDNGEEHSAKIIGTDPRTDLALLKIDGASNLPFVKLAENEVRVGDWVVAVGNPFGLGGTVTAGIVSARGRDLNSSTYDDFIQIDAAVNRGNSGGPDFNLSGEVVGVNTAIFSPNGGNVGIAFAIPAATVKQVVEQLKTHGSVTRGFLGVGIQDVTKDIADSMSLPNTKGALVTNLTDGAPAGKAGVKSGDVIVGVDGKDIANARDLARTIANYAPGSTVDISILRDGKKQDIKVTLDTLKDQQVAQNDQTQPTQPDQPVVSSVGLTLVPNSDGAGLLIQDIDPNSTAASKGFAVGDVILEADNKAVASPQDFENAISGVRDSGRSTILIKASRNGQIRFIGLPLTDTSKQ